MARENEKLIENAQKKLTPKNLVVTPNAQDQKQSKFKFDFVEEKNQMKQEIEMLEALLLEKTTELEEAERLNEINNQKIKQTIELNEQLYFDIEDTTLALQEYEEKIQQLESINKQYADECLRLESLLQSQPNKMYQQMKMAGQLSIDENTSQRTQSIVGKGLTHSQRTFDIHNDYNTNDDNISKSSNIQTKRATAVTNKPKPKLNLAIQSTETQLQKLAKEQRLEQSGLLSVKNKQNNTMQNLQLDLSLNSKQTNKRQNQITTPQVQTSYSKIARGLQIEVDEEKEPELDHADRNQQENGEQYNNTYQQQELNDDIVCEQHVQYVDDQIEGTDQQVELVNNSVRKSQISVEFHFENQDEIHPDEGADQFPVIEENDLVGLEDQDGQPIENFGHYEYAQRPSYLMNSRISTFSHFEKPQPAPTKIVNEQTHVPVTQKLKERAGQIKRIIETTDIVENQNMFEDIRKTFASQRQSMIFTGNLPNAPEPQKQVFVPPKTSRAQATTNKFDFAQKPISKPVESPTGVVNNTYITNHFNNFTAKPIVEELILGPQSLQIRSTQAAITTKKLELVDLDHYQPSKKPQQNMFGNSIPSQLTNQEHSKSGQVTPIRSSFNNTRASHIKLTESMLGAMPVIVEEEEIEHKQTRQANDTKNREPTVKQLSIQVESLNENNRLSSNSDNYNILLPSPSESQTTGSMRRRSVAGRKEPEEEFFSMTLVSQIMCHSKKNLLISLQQDSNKLFKECKKNKKPFFEWPTWISAYLETEIKRMKASSLAKAQKIGAQKIRGK